MSRTLCSHLKLWTIACLCGTALQLEAAPAALNDPCAAPGSCRFREPVWSGPANPADYEQTRQLLVEIAMNVSHRTPSCARTLPRGAALLSTEGLIVSGVSVAGRSPEDTLAAELVALGNAVSEGVSGIHALVIVSADGDAPHPQCMRLLEEISPNCMVLCADREGHVRDAQPVTSWTKKLTSARK